MRAKDKALLQAYLEDPLFKRDVARDCGAGFLTEIEWETNIITFRGNLKTVSMHISTLLAEIKKAHKPASTH